MRKFLISSVIFAMGAAIFAASYTNNTYQKLADEYTQKAQQAFDAGQYDLAVEYSAKAEENAALSEQFIGMMKIRSDAENAINSAERAVAQAKSIDADKNFPVAYSAAEEALSSAKTAFAQENYDSALDYARQVEQALAGVIEVTPLPKYYTVRPWSQTKDCYWNISGRSYVYNNPARWENLYQANKKNMPDANNADLILPGMKMEIPSISGEYREGEYTPSKKYPTFGN